MPFWYSHFLWNLPILTTFGSFNFTRWRCYKHSKVDQFLARWSNEVSQSTNFKAFKMTFWWITTWFKVRIMKQWQKSTPHYVPTILRLFSGHAFPQWWETTSSEDNQVKGIFFSINNQLWVLHVFKATLNVFAELDWTLRQPIVEVLPRITIKPGINWWFSTSPSTHLHIPVTYIHTTSPKLEPTWKLLKYCNFHSQVIKNIGGC